MKFKTFIGIGTCSLVTFLVWSLASARLPTPIPAESVEGKLVWQSRNCIGCHTLFGNGGYFGDDLTHIVAKRSRQDLKEFLTNPPVMRPNLVKHHPGLTSADADSLIAYFAYLDTIPTLGWPPRAYSEGTADED